MLNFRPILLLDMDQTIADLYPELIRRHNTCYGTNLSPRKYKQYFGDHNILTDIISREHVDKIFASGSFFRDLLPIAGAQAAVSYLEQSFDIYIVSNPFLGANHPYMDKYRWLQEFFPTLANKFIATPCKHVVSGRILVDDHMPFCRKWRKYNPDGLVASLQYPWTDMSIVDIVASKWSTLAQKILTAATKAGLISR